MNQENEKNISAENPEIFTGLKLKNPQASAAGLEGVKQALKHVTEEAGLVRGLQALSKLNQKGGFDCPSCAWPDPDDERSGLAEYCENGAKAIADEATAKKIGADFFKENSVSDLAKLSDYEIGKKGRIAEPMYLAEGKDHYLPVTWEFAFNRIAENLNSLASPDEAIFYTSGRTSNEAAFLYQLLVRAFGTNNLPDCSNMCHESSGVALTESLGIGKGSVTLEDIHHAEVILIMGQNPGTNHPRMMTALQKAKKNGATIISVNPLPETGLMAFSNPQELKGLLGFSEKITDHFLQIRLNGDMALLQTWAQMMLMEDKDNPGSILDLPFIRDNTAGYENYANHILNLYRKELIEATGLHESQVEQAYESIKRKNNFVICWAMGLTQHRNAVDTIKEIVNFLLLKGSIGKKGAGTCPVRGHSNVQGDRTMGIYEKPGSEFLKALEIKYRFKPPLKHGFDVVDAIKAMHDGRAKTFFAMGGNFLSATPDTLFTAAALQKCDLTVHVSTKLNRSHLIHGKEAFILPCLARSDKDMFKGKERVVSCENSMGVVQSSRGTLKPVSEMLISEVDIVCLLAEKLLKGKHNIPWMKYREEYDMIRGDIQEVIPGFTDFNARLKNPGGFYLPNCNREGKFNTPQGKAIFNIATIKTENLEENELMMMTIRSHDQFNTTIYGLDDRYRGIFNERRVILMNRNDMRRMSVEHLQTVDITSEKGGRKRIAHKFKALEYPIAEGCTATYFPEANVLVPIENVAEKSNTPVSKLVFVKISPHPDN
jgi:molybdopterin-dependent oxidoreductase alpha subunit